MPRSFESNPLNRLDIQHEAFDNQLRELAFTAPSEYFNLRRQILTNMLEKNIKGMYKQVFEALKDGTGLVDLASLPKSQAIFKDKNGGDGFDPAFNEQKCDEIAMNLCAGLKDLMRKEVVDKILPPNIFDQSITRAGKMSAIQLSNEA